MAVLGGSEVGRGVFKEGTRGSVPERPTAESRFEDRCEFSRDMLEGEVLCEARMRGCWITCEVTEARDR